MGQVSALLVNAALMDSAAATLPPTFVAVCAVMVGVCVSATNVRLLGQRFAARLCVQQVRYKQQHKRAETTTAGCPLPVGPDCEAGVVCHIYSCSRLLYLIYMRSSHMLDAVHHDSSVFVPQQCNSRLVTARVMFLMCLTPGMAWTPIVVWIAPIT